MHFFEDGAAAHYPLPAKLDRCSGHALWPPWAWAPLGLPGDAVEESIEGSDCRVRSSGLGSDLDNYSQLEGLGEGVGRLVAHPHTPSRWVNSFCTAPAPAQPPDSQATGGSGWSLVEPSHDLFPAGQHQLDAVWLGLSKGDRLEMRGKSGERLFGFQIKCPETMDIRAQESTTKALIVLISLFE